MVTSLSITLKDSTVAFIHKFKAEEAPIRLDGRLFNANDICVNMIEDWIENYEQENISRRWKEPEVK